MAPLVRLLLALVICAPGMRPAYGTERAGDASAVYALQGQAEVVDSLERDILALIEHSPDESRFDLYRTYNRLMGTWIQVDLVQAMLELAVSAESPSEEEEIRAGLRDHARFALWDLDEVRIDLEREIAGVNRHEHSRLNDNIRWLLSEAKAVIGRVLIDQCVHVQCVIVP